MSKWTDNSIYEVIIDGVKRKIGPSISELNIQRYKQQDLQRILNNGGELATDEEYENAEIVMQQLYKKIMGEEENATNG